MNKITLNMNRSLFSVSKPAENFYDYPVRYRFKKISMIEQAIKGKFSLSAARVPRRADEYIRAISRGEIWSRRKSTDKWNKNKVRDRFASVGVIICNEVAWYGRHAART